MRKDESWYPFGEHLAENADWQMDSDSRLKLSPALANLLRREFAQVHVTLWCSGGYDGGTDEDEPKNCFIELASFGEEGYSSTVDLAEWLNRSLKGDWSMSGPESEVYALEKLKAVVEDLIAERRIEASKRKGILEGDPSEPPPE